jgi:predicted alpha/beta-fold hydrolase
MQENIRAFNPSFLLKNRHIQTLYAPLFRKDKNLDFSIERFDLEDGDFVECYWHEKERIRDNAPIIILLHGLTGSYKSPYIQGIMSALSQEGYASVLMHFRGCADNPNLMARGYHSGDTQDAKAWIDSLSKRFPHNPLHAIGYSIGGNVLLKLVAESPNLGLSSAISISAPLQLDITAKTINIGFSKLYQRHLLTQLKDIVKEKFKKHPLEKTIGLNPKKLNAMKTIREFDEEYTAKIHHFGSADNYYKQASAKQYLHKITIPSLIIHALDDPFMTAEILPNQEDLPPNISLETSPNGGHVGFVHGSFFRPKYWLEERILDYYKNNEIKAKI